MAEVTPFSHVLWKRKGLVAAILAVSGFAGAAYTYFVTPVWEAQATLIFPVRGPSLLAAPSPLEQVGLAATLTGGATPLKVYGGMLESERALDFVAEKTGLRRLAIAEMREISDRAMRSTLTIRVRHTDSQLAKRVVDLHLQALTVINQDITVPFAGDDVRVLGEQLNDQRGRLKAAEDQLLAFQRTATTGAAIAAVAPGTGQIATTATPANFLQRLRDLEVRKADVDASLAAVRRRMNQLARNREAPTQLPAVERWRTQLSTLTYELEVALQSQGPDSEQVRQTKEKIQAAEAALKSELQRYVDAANQGIFDPYMDRADLPSLILTQVGLDAQISAVQRLVNLAPSEAMTLQRLAREVSVLSGIVQHMTAQFELSRLQEDRNPNRWQVLDAPRVMDRPVNKGYARNGLLFLAFGMLLAVALATFMERRTAGMS